VGSSGRRAQSGGGLGGDRRKERWRWRGLGSHREGRRSSSDEAQQGAAAIECGKVLRLSSAARCGGLVGISRRHMEQQQHGLDLVHLQAVAAALPA
jgi:hypothetical protein